MALVDTLQIVSVCVMPRLCAWRKADTLIVTITQSGETADTLAALRHAQSLGMTHTLTICNVSTEATPISAPARVT